MKKLFLMLVAASAVTFSSCKEDTGTTTETNENDSSTPDGESGTEKTTSYNNEGASRNRANRMSQQVAQDLKLDSMTQARLEAVYFNRARQLEELEARFTATNQSAGSASSDSANEQMMNGEMGVSGTAITYTPAYYSEVETINTNTDSELRGVLSSDQFNLYNANRKKYYEQDMQSWMSSSGKDSKYKADGIKIKRDGDEMKIKTDDMKIKREGNEAKLKAEDTKIKREGDEMKIKTEDSKIKTDN